LDLFVVEKICTEGEIEKKNSGGHHATWPHGVVKT
jgi:hypothetical protein